MSYSILFSYIIFRLKNCTVTCLYCHYLGRIKLILILTRTCMPVSTEGGLAFLFLCLNLFLVLFHFPFVFSLSHFIPYPFFFLTPYYFPPTSLSLPILFLTLTAYPSFFHSRSLSLILSINPRSEHSHSRSMSLLVYSLSLLFPSHSLHHFLFFSVFLSLSVCHSSSLSISTSLSHMLTQRHIHTRMHICTHTSTRTHTHTQISTCMSTHAHARTQAHSLFSPSLYSSLPTSFSLSSFSSPFSPFLCHSPLFLPVFSIA